MKWRETLESTYARVRIIRDEVVEVKRGQIAMNAKLDMVCRSVQDQVTRMADRVIEMAMVNQGGRSDAVKHRHVTRLDDRVPEDTGDPWAEQQDDWPPKGHDSLNMP